MLRKLCCTLVLLSAVITVSKPSDAQGAKPQISGRVGQGSRVRLAHSMSPRVLNGEDLGPVAGDLRMQGVTLVFRRSASQEAELQALLSAQQDPTSPQFHQWLTPASFGQRFGMADEDIAATERWLKTQGFAIDGVSAARDRITFSGTAQQVADAFGTSLHHYRVEGQIHTAPSTDLSLPEELAPLTSAVMHLADFRPAPSIQPAARPKYTSTTGAHYLMPNDLEVMYDLPSKGARGQSVAIVGQTDVDTVNDSIGRFVAQTGGTVQQDVLVPGTGPQAISPDDNAEADIDLEYSAGVNRAGTVFYVYVGGDPDYSVFDALAFAINTNIAPVISISYGECETLLTPNEIEQGNALFEQASSQGQTVIAASGDAGGEGCAFVPSNELTTTQQQALAVDYPADSPYVTAVGGTQMSAGSFAAGTSSYWGPQSTAYDVTSLLSYVPEIAWNEDSSNGLMASGGGASAVLSRPAWQTGVPGIASGTTRLVPDVAFQASTNSPGFLFCADDIGSACANGTTVSTAFDIGGGTSFATPAFAEMVAVLNSDTGSFGLGNLNPTLYKIAATSAGASVFHDITSGTSACTAGDPGCSAAGQSGFAAGTGYDEATGLGSVDYLQLLATWPKVQAATPYTTTISLLSVSGSTPGGPTSLSFQVTVDQTPLPGVPQANLTGNISVLVDGVVVATNVPDAYRTSYGISAGYDFTAPTSVGSHVVTVIYAGDSTHAPSQKTAAFMVGNPIATGGVSIAINNVTVPANGSANTTITVTPSGGYVGRLAWSMTLESANSVLVCYEIPSTAVKGVTQITLFLGAGTTCTNATASLRNGTAEYATRERQRAPWESVSFAAGVLLCWLPVRKRARGLGTLLCVTVIAAVSGLCGCGGSGGSSSPQPITVTVQAHDSVNSGISATTTFSLALQ